MKKLKKKQKTKIPYQKEKNLKAEIMTQGWIIKLNHLDTTEIGIKL